MRLSDIKDDRVFDVIADIVEPVYNIATDEKAAALFKRGGMPEGSDPKAYVLDRMRKALPALLKGHKEDLLAIFAAIEGVGVEEYRKDFDLSKLLKGLYEMVTDEDLLAFLS